MTLEVSVNLSVLRVLAGRMEVKKCRTSLVQVLELLQREGRVSCGNNPGVKWKVHLCSAALGKDFVPELFRSAGMARKASLQLQHLFERATPHPPGALFQQQPGADQTLAATFPPLKEEAMSRVQSCMEMTARTL